MAREFLGLAEALPTASARDLLAHLFLLSYMLIWKQLIIYNTCMDWEDAVLIYIYGFVCRAIGEYQAVYVPADTKITSDLIRSK